MEVMEMIKRSIPSYSSLHLHHLIILLLFIPLRGIPVLVIPGIDVEVEDVAAA